MAIWTSSSRTWMATRSRQSRSSQPRSKSPARDPLRRSMLRACAAVLLAAGVAVPFASTQPTGAPEHATRGEIALSRGNYFDAIEAFSSALRVNPNDTRALLGSAEAHYLLGEYDSARPTIDRALSLAPRNPTALNLSGRILIGLGDLTGALSAFERVLAIEPNNIEARLGRAELAVVQGRTSEALTTLVSSLRLNPEHRQTLLSLVLVAEYHGDIAAAEAYLELARTAHPDDVTVQLLAAEYFLRAGRIGDAIDAAAIAGSIDPDSTRALTLRATLQLTAGGDPEALAEAIALAERLIAADRSAAHAWFVRAAALRRSGAIDTAITSIRTVLRLDPGDEIYRIWAESFALAELGLEHPFRTELARIRRDEARSLVGQFRFERAATAYRRAVQLAPLDFEIRAAYADLLRQVNRPASYLQELRLLGNDGYRTARTDRAIEVFDRAIASSVARRWGIDQFATPRNRHRVAIYLVGRAIPERYPATEAALINHIERSFTFREGVDVVDTRAVGGFADALMQSRAQDVDFFILVDLFADARSFAISGSLHVGSTGAQIAPVGSIRTGPHRVADATESFVTRVLAELPFRATVIARRGRSVLLDRGSRDDLQVGDTLLVVDRTAITRAPDRGGFVFPADAVLAEATVSAVDELVAEATLAIRGGIDAVAIGDASVYEPADGTPAAVTELFPILYERLRLIRATSRLR
ncbi:MAG: hypothetical protein EA382_07805 [Spirochaetaceae bacterium]|nr:MAG: hypothetical protein EA382_07805 [Spirochaetaceae bacterium]